VRVVESRRTASRDLDDLFKFQKRVRLAELIERSGVGDILHDEIHEPLMVPRFVDADDVLMVQHFGSLRLVQEQVLPACAALFGVRGLVVRNLDGYVAARVSVGGEIDAGSAATPEFAAQVILAESLILEALHRRRQLSGIMERVKGIEPSLSAWEAEVLPLNYTRFGLILPSHLHQSIHGGVVKSSQPVPCRVSHNRTRFGADSTPDDTSVNPQIPSR
jgi:hypothetical protein